MVSPVDPHRGEDDALERAYDEFCEVWLEGESLDLDAYCRKFPAIEETLRPRLKKFITMYRRFQEGSGSRGTASATAHTAENQVEGEILGDFRLVREVDRGGMGVVYEARQVSLDRTVALKVLSANLTLREETVARFHREASTAAKLKHPGIVKIHAIGEKEGNHFFAMEFVRGAPLDHVIDRLYHEGAFPRDGKRMGAAVRAKLHRGTDAAQEPETDSSDTEGLDGFWDRTYIETVCRIIARVADALNYAHGASVIHRDIKPSNILVREDGSCVITDFGLARELGGASLTLTGELAGTPHYLAPELAATKKRKPDHRADIYSLGVTLYELLTLTRPYEGRTSQEILGKITAREPPLPRTRNVLIPKDLETICLTAMEKDPANRYASAEAFKEDLLNFLEFRPIKARPMGVTTRTYRLIRRNPTYSAMVGLLFLVVVIGPLVFGVQQHFSNLRVQGALEEKEKALLKAEEERGAKEMALHGVEQERDAKEAALALSEEEAAMAKQITRYLETIFTRFVPEAAEWKRNAADLLLQDVAKAIDTDLTDEPRAQSRLLLTLGRITMGLGNFEEAENLLSHALEAFVLSGADMDESSLMIKSMLASIYMSQARYSETLALYEEMIQDFLKVYGDQHAYTYTHMDHLASLYMRMGEDEKAEATYLDTLERCRMHLGEQDPSTFHCLMFLGSFYLERDRLDDAEIILNDSLEKGRRYLGEDDHYTLYFKRDVGVLEKKKGNYKKAEILFREVHENFCGVHCENCNQVSSLTTTIMLDLAALFQEQGRLDEEESLYLDSLARNREHLGDDHPATLSCMYHLGRFYVLENRLEEADPLLSDCIERCRRSLGKDHMLTIETLGQLGDLYSRQERHEEAKETYSEVLEGYRYSLSERHPITLALKANLASYCCQHGWYEEGIKLISEALAHTPDDSPDYPGWRMLHDYLLQMTGQAAGETASHDGTGPINWANPLHLSSEQGSTELVTVVDRAFAQRMLAQCEQTYDQVTSFFAVEPAMEDQPLVVYLYSSMDEYNTMGNILGDARSSSYAVYLLEGSPDKAPVTVTYLQGHEDAQLRFTEGLVRHAVVELYLRKIDELTQFPSWFIKGQAAKWERYFHPTYIQWSIREVLQPLGGMADLGRIFSTFEYSEQEIHTAGLICAYLDSDEVDPAVKDAYLRVLEAIRNGEAVSAGFYTLESALMKKGATLVKFMNQMESQ